MTPKALSLSLYGEGKTKRVVKLASAWWFGNPIWEGTINGELASVQVRPIVNGYALIYQGIEASARVYTKREAELMAQMPVKAPPDTSKFLLCPMPGLVVSLAVTEGSRSLPAKRFASSRR